jgi:hypothetical protein
MDDVDHVSGDVWHDDYHKESLVPFLVERFLEVEKNGCNVHFPVYVNE